MAYGLRIDNDNGQRVVDDQYNGVYYLGKQTLTTPGAFQVSGNTNSTVPPLVFIKYPKTAGSYTGVEELTFGAAVPTEEEACVAAGGTWSNPGGAGTCSGITGGISGLTLTVPSNVVYCYWFFVNSNNGTQTLSDLVGNPQEVCEAAGGTWNGAMTDHRQCVRTTPLDVSTDEYVRGDPTTDNGGNQSSRELYTSGETPPAGHETVTVTDGIYAYNNREASVELTFNSSGTPTGATVTGPGYGWGIGDSEFLGNNATYELLLNPDSQHYPVGRGFYPYNHVTDTWHNNSVGDDANVTPSITATSLASGWNGVLTGSFSEDVTLYYFGVGGEPVVSNEYGLSIFNDSGDTVFSTRRPPPVLRSITNISFNSVSYAEVSINSNETLNFPLATTAMSSLPVAPSAIGSNNVTPIRPPLFGGSVRRADAGLRFSASGSTLSKIVFQSAAGIEEVQFGSGRCGNVNLTVNINAPFWTITSGSQGFHSYTYDMCSLSGTFTNITGVTWNINHDCLFLDTAIYDTLPF